MNNLDTLIQMLNSSKSSVRYDACEELRVSTESSEAVIFALEKTLEDSDKLVSEAAKRALTADVHRKLLRKMGKPYPLSDNEIRDQLWEKREHLLEDVHQISSEIEAYRIKTNPKWEYLEIDSSYLEDYGGLNGLGVEGWELVGLSTFEVGGSTLLGGVEYTVKVKYLFKRQLTALTKTLRDRIEKLLTELPPDMQQLLPHGWYLQDE